MSWTGSETQRREQRGCSAGGYVPTFTPKENTAAKPKPKKPRSGLAPIIQHASHYALRAEALAFVGFDSYAEYLRSDIWAAIKARLMFKSNGNRRYCKVCNKKPAHTLHHLSYSIPVLLGKESNQLIPICAGCHKAIEFTSGGSKRTDGKSVASAMKSRIQRRRGKRATVKLRKKFSLKCRICRKGSGNGRAGICLKCYKQYGPKVHEIAAQRDIGQ